MKEHYKYPFIIVYEDGRIYSKKSNKFLKQMINHNGYFIINIKPNGRQDKNKILRVHRLVAECFIDNPENKLFVNHKDGNKQNNDKNNLEWVTPKENSNHALKNGGLIIKNGEEFSSSKLKNKDIIFIRNTYKPYDKVFGTRSLAKNIMFLIQLFRIL